MSEKSNVTTQNTAPSDSVNDDLTIDSVALARLIDEVRNEEMMVGRHYNRQHNRHNR